MKSLKIAGLCLASMLVMSMALAGTAAAAGPLWLVCLEGTNLTRYTTNQCSTASGTGAWQSQGLTVTEAHTIKILSDTVKIRAFTLRLADTSTGATVTCSPSESVGWGLIEGPNKIVTKVATIKSPETECEVTKSALIGCVKGAKVEKVEAINLPWTSELEEPGGILLVKLKGGGSKGKEPGWKIRCGGIEDVCEGEVGEEESVALSNQVTGGVLLIRGVFEKKVKGPCTVGGAKAGEVEGLVAILLWNGQALSVSSI